MTKSLEKINNNLEIIQKSLSDLSQETGQISNELKSTILECTNCMTSNIDPMIFAVTIFVLSCFVGYYVVWKVTPALHTPLMAVTNAISGIIILGAIIALGPESGFLASKISGFIAVLIASINIFGGFVVTHRMLKMFKKK